MMNQFTNSRPPYRNIMDVTCRHCAVEATRRLACVILVLQWLEVS